MVLKLTIRISLLVLLGLNIAGVMRAQQPQYISPERPITSSIEKGERKVFKVKIEAGHYAQIHVQQNYIFVHPVVFSESGEKLFEVRRPVDYLESKRFTLLAENAPKEFIIELTGDHIDATGNGFGIKIAEQGVINEKARLRYQAEQLLCSVPVALTDYTLKEQDRQKLEKAVELARKIGDPWFSGLLLRNLGLFNLMTFRSAKATDALEEALRLSEEARDLKSQASTYQQMTTVFVALERYDKAVEVAEKGLILYTQIDNRWGISAISASLGNMYYSLGEYEKAIAQVEKGFKAYMPRTRGYVWLGNSYFELGDYQTAKQKYQLALDEMARDFRDQIPYNNTLRRMGLVYARLGQENKAIEYLSQAIEREKKENNFSVLPAAMADLGQIYYKQGNRELALEHFRRSLAASFESGKLSDEANARYWIARAYFDAGDLDKALVESAKSVELSEQVRMEISSEEMRSAFFGRVSSYFELQIDILNAMHSKLPEKGYDRRAFEVSERSRARAFLDGIRSIGADLRQGVPSELLEKERQLIALINEDAAKKRGAKTKQESERFEKEIVSYAAELDLLRAKIKRSNPDYASIVQEAKPVEAAELQQHLLDGETAFLEFKLGSERSYAWVITESDFRMVILPARRVIEDSAKEVYALLTGGRKLTRSAETSEGGLAADAKKDEIDRALRQLSDLVFAPLGKLGKKRLLVASDDVLQYVPFSALRYEDKFVAESFEITSVPSAALLAELRKREKRKDENRQRLAVIADPVFDKNDSRLAVQRKISSTPDVLPRLLFSRQEATAIASMLPKEEVFLALGFDADKTAVIENKLSGFKIVHFATHGFLDSANPQLSGLALSMVGPDGREKNGFLRLHEVYGLRMPADLVVLSGCQTAMGKDVRGEGLIGLTRGFIYAGASKVAASLWQVDDAATAELMKHFYTGLIKEKLSPSAAMRSAQVKMLSTSRWQNPYYWAAFTIQGDWR